MQITGEKYLKGSNLNNLSSGRLASFAVFCMLQNLFRTKSAFIDVCDPGDEKWFDKTFDNVYKLDRTGFYNFRRKSFDLVAFQDLQGVMDIIFHNSCDKEKMLEFIEYIHGTLSRNGMFVFGCSNFFYRTVNRHIKRPLFTGSGFYIKALKNAGFSEVKLFYSIPSHKNIMHICQNDKLAMDYYMEYLYPEPEGIFKNIIFSFLKKNRFISMFLPSCIIVATA